MVGNDIYIPTFICANVKWGFIYSDSKLTLTEPIEIQEKEIDDTLGKCSISIQHFLFKSTHGASFIKATKNPLISF